MVALTLSVLNAKKKTHPHRVCFFVYLCRRKTKAKNYTVMKIKLTRKQIEQLAADPDSKVEINDPWFIIVLKVIAYLAGLLLAGYGTAAATTSIIAM